MRVVADIARQGIQAAGGRHGRSTGGGNRRAARDIERLMGYAQGHHAQQIDKDLAAAEFPWLKSFAWVRTSSSCKALPHLGKEGAR
jgi:hypothetical protein